MKKTAIYAFVAALAAVTTVSCTKSQTTATDDAPATQSVEQAAPEAEPAEAGVVKLTDDQMFRPDTKVDVLTVLDFNATWCVPCKKLTPAYDKAAESMGERVRFYSVDIEQNPQTAAAFGIQSVPTVAFLSPTGSAPIMFVGLDPFIGDKQVNGMTPDEVTDVIYTNLKGLIEDSLK